MCALFSNNLNVMTTSTCYRGLPNSLPIFFTFMKTTMSNIVNVNAVNLFISCESTDLRLQQNKRNGFIASPPHT